MIEWKDRATPGERLPPVIGTYSGGCFHVLNPRPGDVKLIDIAHHLAGIARYTGACNRVWSVGAHSLEVSRRIALAGGTYVEQLQGLLHDASEAYLVDIPRPIKPDIYFARGEGISGFDSYYEVEDRVMRVIFAALHVPYPLSKIVHDVDTDIGHDEVANFFGPGFIWSRYKITEAKRNLKPLYLEECKWAFIDRYGELQQAIVREEEAA